jgi:hypothetical protein
VPGGSREDECLLSVCATHSTTGATCSRQAVTGVYKFGCQPRRDPADALAGLDGPARGVRALSEQCGHVRINRGPRALIHLTMD